MTEAVELDSSDEVLGIEDVIGKIGIGGQFEKWKTGASRKPPKKSRRNA